MSSKRYDSSKQWYTRYTYSGYEEKSRRNRQPEPESLDMADKIFGVMVPKKKNK